MTDRTKETLELGDLIAAAFDEAERYSSDPKEASRLAAQVVSRLVFREGKLSVPQPITRIVATTTWANRRRYKFRGIFGSVSGARSSVSSPKKAPYAADIC